MRSHEIDYKIVGHDMQMVEIELDNNETVIAEAGAMTYMESGITFEVHMGDGSTADHGVIGKLFNAGKRVMTGNSVFMTHFTYHGNKKGHVGFAAPHPGTIIPVNMKDVGGGLICQKGSFLCAAKGTSIGVAFTRKLSAGFLGGEGFVLQRLSGDGMAFVHAGGIVVRKQLRNAELRVDPGCIVAFEPSIDYSIERAGKLKSMMFGGEGLFLARLRGTGSVLLQSLPFSRMADRIVSSSSDHSSVVSAVENIFD